MILSPKKKKKCHFSSLFQREHEDGLKLERERE